MVLCSDVSIPPGMLVNLIKGNPKLNTLTFSLSDHISSFPNVLFPVKELTELCHQYNVLVLIDGANVPGQQTLNIEEIGADFYVGRWLSSYTSEDCGFSLF